MITGLKIGNLENLITTEVKYCLLLYMQLPLN